MTRMLRIVCPKCGADQGNVCVPDTKENKEIDKVEITCWKCRAEMKERGEYLPFGQF